MTAQIIVTPTKTRRALLTEIGNGDVFRDAIGDSYISGGPKVTARVAELEKAGWVLLSDAQPGRQTTKWQLTDAGREWLPR